MIHDNSPIVQIFNVSNGWIVQINDKFAYQKSRPQDEMVQGMVAGFREAGLLPGQDEKMDNIRKLQKEIKYPPLVDQKDTSMFIFKKFSEVVAFLKLTIEENA